MRCFDREIESLNLDFHILNTLVNGRIIYEINRKDHKEDLNGAQHNN